MGYPHQQIEEAAQALWREQNLFATREDAAGDKFYCLSMFPYPSGRLHMGHVRNYTIGDMLSRYRRMRGDNVLQPMGWDAFGLPAENAAIDNNIAPHIWTQNNINEMRTQLTRLGLAVDWSRELATCDETYYVWEQLLFTRLFKQGLVYKKKATVNWDPVDNTVLANEQVVDGCGWRSGAPIERRNIPMYFMAITKYADELLDELDTMDGFPDSVKTMQRNWIGRSDGVHVRFALEESDIAGVADIPLEFYSTRPDTIYGVTFCAIAPEHPLAAAVAKTDPQLQAFIDECSKLAVAEGALEKVEKSGYRLPMQALHPLEDRKIPIYVANYILAQYGTGAIYGCPAHDQRDLDFARSYGLPVIPVISPDVNETPTITDTALLDEGYLINSDSFNGLHYKEAQKQIIAKFESLGVGKAQQAYRLRDWGISRQRYWGCPVPIVHCSACGDVPEKEENLPVRLPTDVKLDGRGSPLSRMESFVNCACPQCGAPAKRECDTMDTFVESSWYFARFASHDCAGAIIDERAHAWMPVSQYIGGIEHACLHLLYARFFHKLMRDAGLYPKDKKYDEPFARLLCQGMVLKDGAKMSKSKGNTVDPQELIETYGADTARLFMLFAAPPERALEWSSDGVNGCARFLTRLWEIGQEFPQWLDAASEADEDDDDGGNSNESEQVQAHRREYNQILQKADYDMERMRYNNIPSAAMRLVNLMVKIRSERGVRGLLNEMMSALLRLLAPAVPHITQALWQQLGYGSIIANAEWIKVEATQAQQNISLVVQVNGKKRAQIVVPANADKDAIIAQALADEHVQKFVTTTPRKTIVVPNKIVNIVV